MMRLKCFALGVLVLLVGTWLAAAGVRGGDWPQFRGPTVQGTCEETNLPTVWSAETNVVWKTAIPGDGWSSPAIVAGRVFLTTATEGGETCRVLAVDTATGKVLWDRDVFSQLLRRKEDRNSYATPTPAADAERVYTCFGDGSFAACDRGGNVVWTNRNYPHYSKHGMGTSPILYRDLLIMARDGSSDGPDPALGWTKPWDKAYIVALDVRTGAERWKASRGMSRVSHGVPVIWGEASGGPQLVSESGDVLQGFDPATGARLWTSRVIGEGKVPSVVLGEGLAFTSGGYSGRESIKGFRLGGSGDLEESNLVWEVKRGMPKVPSLIHVAPHVYAVSDAGVLSCIVAKTGELLWQERLGGNFSASPISSEGHVYFLADDGTTTIVEAGPTFRVISRNLLGEKCQASIAVSNGRLFIRTEKNLYCIGGSAK